MLVFTLAPFLLSSLGFVAQGATGLAAWRFVTPPNLDGDLSEWLTATAATEGPEALVISRHDQVVAQRPEGGAEHTEGGLGGWRGVDDLSATFFLGFDDQYLYLAGRVKDDGIAYDDAYWWEGDAISLYLDLDVASDRGVDSFNSDDVQIFLMPTALGRRWGVGFRDGRRLASDGDLDGVVVASRVLAKDEYTFEAALPWRNFTSVLQSRTEDIAFNIEVIDHDNAATTGRDDYCSMTLNGKDELAQHPSRFLPLHLPGRSEASLAAGEGSIAPVLLRVGAAAVALLVILGFALFARRLHRLIVLGLPSWRHLGLAVIGVIAFAILIAPRVVLAWIEDRVRDELAMRTSLLTDQLSHLAAERVFEHWPGFADPHLLAAFLKGESVQPDQRYQFVPIALKEPGAAVPRETWVAADGTPFLLTSVALLEGRSTTLELASRTTVREVQLLLRGEPRMRGRAAGIGRSDAVRLMLHGDRGPPQSWILSLDDGRASDARAPHSGPYRVAWRDADGHSDLITIMPRVDLGSITRVTLEPLDPDLVVTARGLTLVTAAQGPIPEAINAFTRDGIPCDLFDGTAATAGLVASNIVQKQRIEIPVQKSLHRLWLVYGTDDARLAHGREGLEVGRIQVLFTDGSPPLVVPLRVGINIDHGDLSMRGHPSDMQSRVAVTWDQSGRTHHLDWLEVDGLGGRTVDRVVLDNTEPQALAGGALRLAAITGGVLTAPPTLSANVPIQVNGTGLSLRADVANELSLLAIAIARDGLVGATNLDLELDRRLVGTVLELPQETQRASGEEDVGSVVRLPETKSLVYGTREFLSQDLMLRLEHTSLHLRTMLEIEGREAIYRARTGVAAISSLLVLPFALFYLVDYARRFRKIRLKLTTLFIVTSIAPIVLLFLLLFNLVREEREQFSRSRADELLTATRNRLGELAVSAQDLATKGVGDATLQALIAKGADAHAIGDELRALAIAFPERGVSVAVRLDLVGPNGNRTSIFDRPEHEKLSRFDALVVPGLRYHWGEMIFAGVHEHAEEPWYRLSVAGIVDAALLRAAQPHKDGVVTLYSATRRTLSERHVGGIPIAFASTGGWCEDSYTTQVAADALAEGLGPHVVEDASGQLSMFELLTDPNGLPVAMAGVHVTGGAHQLDFAIGKLELDWFFFFFGAVILASATFLGFVVTDEIVIPIERLEKGTRALSKGQPAEAVVGTSADELGKLTDAYNYMAGELNQRLAEQARLQQSLTSLTSTLELEDRVRAALEIMARELQPHALTCLLYDRDRDCLRSSGRADAIVIERNDGPLFQALGKDVHEIGETDRGHPQYAELVRACHLGEGAVLLLPLGRGGKEVGIMVADFEVGVQPMGRLHAPFLTNLTNQIGVALDNARLYQLAVEDPLTGLSVHNYFLARLAAELDRAAFSARAVTVLKLKLEGFDDFQETYGVEAGRLLICKVAQVLKAQCRAMDLVARASTDEFEVMLPVGGRERADEIARRTIDQCSTFDLGDGRQPQIQLRSSVAVYPEDGRSKEFLLDTLNRKLLSVRVRPTASRGELPAKRTSLLEKMPGVVFHSARMHEILDQIERVAAANATVMVLGETGVGKEIVAQLIHRGGDRALKPFVAVNCSALPETLLESELFGHEKGAFTGADRQKIGRFEQADGGTLFLDEVGEMSLTTQAKLLRVLQEKQIERLGGVKPLAVDVRIVTATNRNLERMVHEGTFREDLYYRLKVITITIPPLRERRDEIPILAEQFVRQLSREMGRNVERIEPAALDKLFHHSWPGNVRELRNVVQRAIVLCDGDHIRPQHIVLEEPTAPAAKAAASIDARTELGTDAQELNERQRRVIEFLQRERTITNRQYFEMVGVSRRTGLRDLTDLITRGVITRSGRRKGSMYRLSG